MLASATLSGLRELLHRQSYHVKKTCSNTISSTRRPMLGKQFAPGGLGGLVVSGELRLQSKYSTVFRAMAWNVISHTPSDDS